LRLHHDKFNEALRELPGLRVGLDFGHGSQTIVDHEQEHEHDYGLPPASSLVLMLQLVIVIVPYFPGGRTIASTYGCF
jgi:hypothetical protein